jgi:hypothetical protein
VSLGVDLGTERDRERESERESVCVSQREREVAATPKTVSKVTLLLNARTHAAP